MKSWLRPPERSANVTVPFGPSNTYSFSTRSRGNSRRSRLSSSRWCVNSFSFFKNSLRAATHSSCDTTFVCFGSVFALAMFILLCIHFLWRFLRRMLCPPLLHHQRGHAPAGNRAPENHRHCRHACRTHFPPPPPNPPSAPQLSLRPPSSLVRGCAPNPCSRPRGAGPR